MLTEFFSPLLKDGIAFYLGNQQDDLAFGNNGKDAHYDSSSSSEDEEAI